MITARAAALLSLVAALAAPRVLADEPWYRSPSLAIMTGFIYEPKSEYTIRKWEQDLGSEFDADQWVRDFKEAGASYLIFYDKWIDGFVFHDTKTTGYKTKRDFVREIADACHRHDLRLVFYFNAMTDGNPEFEKWSLIGKDGAPLIFGPGWPTRVQTLCSPFRDVSVAQVRELLTQYGQVDGLWLDIFGDRGLQSTSEFVPRAYEKMYGEPLEKATPTRRAEFSCRTLGGYLDDVRAIAAEHQPQCVWTSNGSSQSFTMGGRWSKWVGSRLDFLSSEGHHQPQIGRLARIARPCGKRTEIGELLNRSWFTPLSDEPPPASKTPAQAIAEVAEMVCSGASVYMALTPGHAGTFAQDLAAAKAVGAWHRTVEPFVTAAQPRVDLGIALGTPSPDGPGMPHANSLWTRFGASQINAVDEALRAQDAVEDAGYLTELLFANGESGNWPASLKGYRCVVLPERALLDDERVEQLRDYVEDGGCLIAFGHAGSLDDRGTARATTDLDRLLGIERKGEVEFPPEAFPATPYAGSVYQAQYSPQNFLDEAPTFWASGDTPMPHWAQVNLAVPIDMAKVELVSREGPYLVTDLDVMTYDGKNWHVVKSVRGADTKTIVVGFDAPMRQQYVRLNILRELYQGEERQIADVEAVRVFDTAGRNWATSQAQRVPLVDLSPELAQATNGAELSFAPMALKVEPTTASVLAWLDVVGRPPAVLRNRVGGGTAYFVTTSEASLRETPAFWSALLRVAVGASTVHCGEQDRYKTLLSRVGDAHVLYVIDRHAGRIDYAPSSVEVSLNASRFEEADSLSLIDGTKLPALRDDWWMTVKLRPDPVSTVVLR